MMVTFVAQCEKKALIKTRRVLDAFANRIGSRTWQTVITLEGLEAVKKLLRRTASKNTAVSCHWSRSRSRSELVWVVGNKDRFNADGYVPVNYTNQEDVLKMDEIEVNIKKYYANTTKQTLDLHLFAVGYISQQIIKSFFGSREEKLSQVAFIAGCLHDIGKIDPEFQKWISVKTKKNLIEELPDDGQHIDIKSSKGWFEKHSRHNEISLLLYHLAEDKGGVNQASLERISHAIYWHHTKPFRKQNNEIRDLYGIYSKLGIDLFNTEKNEFLSTCNQMITAVNVISSEYDEGLPKLLCSIKTLDDSQKRSLQKTELPKYKDYYSNQYINEYPNELLINAKNNLARAAVVQADRLVSRLSQEALSEHIDEATLNILLEEKLPQKRGLKTHIQSCLTGFIERSDADEKRNKAQAVAAKKLSDVEHIGILRGPAGCGKTKIALEWAANTNARKIIWICPRVQVCLGLVNDLTEIDYLPQAKIEICTGEYKFIYQNGTASETPEEDEFSGDIVITTIDQVINTVTTHNKITSLVQYMHSHVVFDEFHEYINMPAFNLLFAELVECKKLQKDKAQTLLVSATPNYFFIKELLEIDSDDITGIDSFNQSEYAIDFISYDESKYETSNPLYQLQPANTFVISNTAITAQKSFITHQSDENALLIHSKYKKDDKKKLFEQVIDSFKRNGNKSFDLLRSGPIVQASLNISCDRMITEFTSAENWLQRLGRLDRFGENSNPNEYITAIPDSIAEYGKQTGGCAKFLNRLHSFQSSKAWYECLQNQNLNGPVTLTQVYQIYSDFYKNEKYRNAIEQDLLAALKQGVQIICGKLSEPISFPGRKQSKDRKIKLPKSSLRGDNRFVQMAVCKINRQGELEFPNHYSYEETDLDANLTYSIEPIVGYGDSRQNLLAYMAKKHHNIANVKKSYNDNVLLNEARNPEAPIYLSYTPDDLQKVGGEPQRHQHAIYYAIGEKQPIGAISITQLQSGEEN